MLLFLGVGCGLIAVICMAIAHRLLTTTRAAAAAKGEATGLITNSDGSGDAAPPKPSFARGLVVAIIGGLLMGSWSPLSTKVGPFGSEKGGGGAGFVDLLLL